MPVRGIMEVIEKIDIKRLQYEIARHRLERSYKLLFLHFHKSLTGFTLGFVKIPEVAEEIVSDVMIKLWMMQEKLDEIENLKVYLFTAVKNASINYLKKHQHVIEWNADNVDTHINLDLYNPEDILLKNEFRRKIAAAIRSLPSKCRQVYKLVREDGFSYKEVASILEISENTVDRHLNIALHKLTESVRTYLAGGHH